MPQLLVTVHRLNKRKVIPAVLPDPNNIAGNVFLNDNFEGEEVTTVPNLALGKWYVDRDGYYYWGGGLKEKIQGPQAFIAPVIETQIVFNWFNQLKIQNIWDQFHEKGELVRIAILDTGYKFSNQDLTNKIKSTKLLITSDQYPGVDLIMDDQSNDAHGNRCVSIVGAGNTRQWIVGIAPKCEVIVGKISIDKEIMDFNYIIEGIKWAIAENADVVSISYAYEDLKKEEIKRINDTITQITKDKSILIFASAGNSGAVQKTADFHPASFDNCVSVGAVGKTDQISRITVLSSKTIIHAPGEEIESYDLQNIPTPESGTSFSTPIVAGIAALAISFLKKRDHNWDKKELLRKIYNTGDNIPGSNTKKIINPIKLFNSL